MLFGMSSIILKWSHSPDLNIFRFSCFKIGQSEPRVAYESVAYKKACIYKNQSHKNHIAEFGFQNKNNQGSSLDYVIILKNDVV